MAVTSFSGVIQSIEIDDPSLPNHTICMRRVLKYCLEQYASLSPVTISKRVHQENQIPPSQFRKQALSDFRERLQIDEPGASIMEIDSWDSISPLEFQTQFQKANLPCKINNASAYFRDAVALWTYEERASSESSGRKTNYDWFIQELGPDTTVPVRYAPVSEAEENGNTGLDDRGLASECSIVEMPLRDWIQLVKHNDDDANNINGMSRHERVRYYLKDWHLMKQIQRSKTQEIDFNTTSASSLYSVPPHLAPDLLNNYLSFSNSDYKFVYWGPKGSSTTLHSDVMGSFSWSYNICGSKQWTIHVPNVCDEEQVENLVIDSGSHDVKATRLTVHQKAGECMFLPSGWLHSVVNTASETLSINHNWITTANIDIVWEVLRAEMEEIDSELARWPEGAGDAEAKEFMLLGCVGLNVSSFLLMTILGMVQAIDKESQCASLESQADLVRLSGLLDKVVKVEASEVCLDDRLQAALGDKILAETTKEIVNLLQSKILWSTCGQ